jgi:hypothetical protein
MERKKAAPDNPRLQGPDAPSARPRLDIPCQVASPQSLTPLLQAV